MYHFMSAAAMALLPIAATGADERNYTLRGDGWFDGGNERFNRLPMREVRMTLRDNGEFAVTLFVRNERYLVRGRWDRNRGGVERIDIDQAFGARASGSGALHFTYAGGAPQRLLLEGRTGDAPFHAEIAADGDRNGNDPRDRDERWNIALGRGDRLHANLDLSARGEGTLRMSGVRDGQVNSVRASLRTNRDVRIDLEQPTRSSIRGEVVEVRDNRVRVRVTEINGARGSGELDLTVRNRDGIERVTGSGGSREGSWQFDFDGREGRFTDRRDDPWLDAYESNDRGSGRLRQDVGPDLSFDRMRVRLDRDRRAIIVLEGRRQSIQLRGEWRADGRDVRIDLTAINEVRARGRLTLERSGTRVERLEGDGRTDLGRFDVRFTR